MSSIVKEFLTKKEVCQWLSISPRTLDLWKAKFGLPVVKLGNVCRYRSADVQSWFMRFQQRKETDNE